MARVGVLALQGDYEAHAARFRAAGAEVVEVRRPAALAGLDALVLPGGESTTLLRLMAPWDFAGALRRFHAQGGAFFATCAGVILLARRVEGPTQPSLGLLDVAVRRNAYGRQRESFAVSLGVAGLPPPKLRGIFIRAPRILAAGPAAAVLARVDGDPVLVRQDRILAATFHPELTGDLRLQRFFLRECLGPARPAPGAAAATGR